MEVKEYTAVSVTITAKVKAGFCTLKCTSVGGDHTSSVKMGLLASDN